MVCCKDDPTSSSCSCKATSATSQHQCGDSTTPNGTSALTVPLKRKHRRSNSPHPPVWAISSTEDAPLPAKCDRHVDSREGVCCKELKGEDERTLVDPDVVRDVIIGLSDGLTVPFALTAGLSGIGDSRIVVMGGLAELIAGAISMGVGGFLASQSERDHFRYLRAHTQERVQRSCDGEMEREVHAVLGPLGVEEKLSVSLALNLRRVEDEMIQNPSNGKNTIRDGVNGGLESAGGLKWSDDVGLTAFLLKFGEGLEEVPTRRLYISALTIGSGYFFGGLIPLLPYFFIHEVQTALMYSCIVTGIILLIFGAFKTHYTGATGGWKGYLWGAMTMLMVGGSAAGAAFAIVRALEGSDL
ncbi:hypothetical protein FRB96_006451 [Tulasnella sp. 330]|nr:hypothetical protein FRB96_006451 [Tulasnella sp. 330]KAG8869444.1 hypothetical protein FRB97_001227 [Tulasnella sp. 331]KAG8870975.1 hypothetical protein FRB98_001148 [Tulasnella sp. 332]